jgi:NAD+ diphosphatase
MKLFNYCPSCNSKSISYDGIKKSYCKDCSFIFFHNIAAAVAAIMEYQEEIIFIKRNKEPGKGMLDLPGGFVDPNETVEQAIRREIKEELNIDIETFRYLGSSPNVYEYKNVRYNTCDLFFQCRIETYPEKFDEREIEKLVLIKPEALIIEELAFESTRNFLKLFFNKN